MTSQEKEASKKTVTAAQLAELHALCPYMTCSLPQDRRGEAYLGPALVRYLDLIYGNSWAFIRESNYIVVGRQRAGYLLPVEPGEVSYLDLDEAEVKAGFYEFYALELQ